MNTMLLKLYVKFQDLMDREEGQSLVEYGLVLALVALASITMLSNIGTQVLAVFTKINTALTNAA